MLSISDFSKKQILFVFLNHGERLSFTNDNLVVRTKEDKVKFQCTCYRIFLVYVVGNGSITSTLMQRVRRFGFSMVFMTSTFKPYQTIGCAKEGNTLLRQMQYSYNEIDLAVHITKNKLMNQRKELMSIRSRSNLQQKAVEMIDECIDALKNCTDIYAVMGIEGFVSRQYFKSYFDNVKWTGRKPRIKHDMINALLDIGYTILFNFINALLESYGFDTYYGVLHRCFYMRKSLTCDIVEPFRVLIERQIKKSINLGQCKEDDFIVINLAYQLKWEKNAEYMKWLIQPILENKEEIFKYIQSYYRAFMKNKNVSDYPMFFVR